MNNWNWWPRKHLPFKGLRIGTIRRRLLVAFVLLVLLPAIVISTASVVLGLRSAQEKVINQLESVATLKEKQIDAWLESLQSHLGLILYPHQAPRLLEPLLNADPQSPAYQGAYNELRIQLNQAIEHSRLFEQIFLLDQHGRVVISTNTQQEGDVHAFQPYFRKGLKGTHVQSLSSSTSQGSSPVIVACPILDLSGKPQGVIVGQASSERLNEIMTQRTGLRTTGETYLVGSNYLLLTETRSQSQDHGVFRLHTEGVDTVLRTERNLSGLYANYHNVPVVGVYHWLPSLEMVLIAEQGQSEAFESTITMLVVNLAVALVAVLLAVGFGFLVVRGIAAPLANLSETATRIATGDLNLTAQIDREDEIGVLARAFNQMTSRLHSLIDSLEHRVQELKQTQEELRWAKEAAEAASRAKSAFLANMSHELRTPLNAIIGYAEMLQEEATDLGNDELQMDLRKINTAAHHLLELISDILDLSKIEAGRIELAVEQFSVDDLINTSIITVQSLVERNGNTLSVEYLGEPGSMQSDMLRVRQILVNVLSNAAKFTNQGTITISVERQQMSHAPLATATSQNGANGGCSGCDAASLDLDRECICFRISDTGIGMSPEQVTQLFQPFTQADVSTTRKYGGTGLGLSITWRFCQLMGGSISVESALNQGSTFTIVLPTRIAKHTADVLPGPMQMQVKEQGR